MSNRNTPFAAPWRGRSLRRLRFTAVSIIAVLMTLSAPIYTAQNAVRDPEITIDKPLDLKRYAKEQSSLLYGWSQIQHGCLNRLWGKESAWNHLADNPHSSAFGIAQMLNETSRDPLEQIRNGLRYIEHRYENPCNAWAHWKKRNYY